MIYGIFMLGALLVMLTIGLGIKQAAHILINGSIFKSLRTKILAGSENGIWVYEKLQELFSCKLCMTTQVSCWWVGLPLTCIAFFIFHPFRAMFGHQLSTLQELLVTLLAGSFLTMAEAAIGLGLWQVLDFKSREDVLEEKVKDLERQLTKYRRVPGKAA